MNSEPMSRSHLHSFSRVLPFLRHAKVLDLGCASGHYLGHFGPGSVGLDLSPADLSACRAKGLDVKAADLDRSFPIEGGEFDAVFCSNVLEHVASPLHLLREARRALRGPGGHLVLALPIEGSLSDLTRRNRYFEDHSGHIYSFSPRNIRRLLAAAGFEVSFHHVEPWPASVLSRIGLVRVVERVLQRLPLALSLRFGDNYWTVAKAVPVDTSDGAWFTDGDRMRAPATMGA